ncbi:MULTISPECIES: helix-turn-helix domain-containing protein [Vagococcus]|uniref:Transcriptional regulator, XRE family n=1 Tax=Vagococcus fluvialis bH819 TaxID=1255619 RepID=A0A1X6WKZ5_9ENTE|nr:MULTISPECIES: helix-turn-helix domain-containing protein [Vagococcus]SLM85003.1 Transcriptional regulator, XRE family [Vagococcus fluvialis bH819]HCM88581.1 helix-turn-helix domain-containing protein [Vagococcus sp.]
MTLGRRLKQVRVEKGFSQAEVADFLNISRQSISRWETDKAYPDLDNLVELSKYYEVSIDELLTETKVLQHEINQKTEQMNKNIEEIEKKRQKLNQLLSSDSDESWVLLLFTALSIAIAPFGLIALPLVLWRNKKDNQFYKLIVILSILIFVYNVHVFTVWITTALEIGVITDIQ